MCHAVKINLSTSTSHVRTPFSEPLGKYIRVFYRYEGVYEKLPGNDDRKVDALIEDLKKALWHVEARSGTAIAVMKVLKARMEKSMLAPFRVFAETSSTVMRGWGRYMSYNHSIDGYGALCVGCTIHSLVSMMDAESHEHNRAPHGWSDKDGVVKPERRDTAPALQPSPPAPANWLSPSPNGLLSNACFFAFFVHADVFVDRKSLQVRRLHRNLPSDAWYGRA